MLSLDQIKALNINDLEINLGDMGAAQPSITYGSADTITITGIDYSDVTLNTGISSVGYGAVPPGATVGGIYTTTGTSNGYSINYNGTHTFTTPSVNITQTGIEINEGGDIKVGDVSLKEFINKMEQRLSILVPDSKKLEKFEALKRAYEHYKTMESLCFDEPIQEEPK
jgi:hypothetical protein